MFQIKGKKDTGYPTKEEFEKNIRQLQTLELHSDRFKKTKEFISLYNKRENLDLEKKLFKIVGTYGVNYDLLNKSYDERRQIYQEKYDELKKFMNSLTQEEINSNIYLKAASNFMETSIKDCKIIIQELLNQIKNLEILSENERFEVNINIPKERLNLLPTSIQTQTSIPYYRPNAYKNEHVYILDENNRHIYEEYNKYVTNREKLAEDIYYLQMYYLLSIYSEEIYNYYFNILNNDIDHEFRTGYFVTKKKENKISSLSEEDKNNISKIARVPLDGNYIVTIEKVNESESSKLILKNY